MVTYEDLTIFNYDSKTGSKITAALNKLKKAEESQTIFNVEFQDLKLVFNRVHSICLSEVFSTLCKKHHIVSIYDLPEAIRELAFINKERPGGAIKKIYSNGEIVDHPLVSDYVEYLELVDDVVKRIDALKPFIKKGRKPNENTANKFQPNIASRATVDILDATFRVACEALVEEIRLHYLSGPKEIANIYEDQTSSTQYSMRTSYPFLFDKESKLLKDDLLEKKISEYAKETTKAVINNFIHKNISKIGSILDKKGQLSSMDVIRAKVSKGKLDCTVSFKLENGASFTVISKIVSVFSRTVFTRYPTTFHDIVDSRGEFHKTQSEEWMNTEF